MKYVPTLWSIGVVIPARNEAATIERCVRSVLDSCETCGRCMSSWVVAVADRCTDETASLGRSALGSRGEVLESVSGSVGSARRSGVAAVLRHFAGRDTTRVWLANTDADTYVPRDWIGTHLQHADRGAVAVAGIIELDTEGLVKGIQDLHDGRYRLSKDGTHAHVHGANLGVRADAYLAAGGWSDIGLSEDHCLWRRLRSLGAQLASPVASVVHTSARLHGRVVGGFADSLRLGQLDD